MRAFMIVTLLTIGLFASKAWAEIATSAKYSWLSTYSHQDALINRIETPTGYTRTRCANGSFCQWLRYLPLKPAGSPVRYYDGGIKHHANHHSVIDLDTGEKNLQQCADAVMRLKAEYHYAKQDYSKIHFNFTSGHKVSFDDWRRGRKPQVSGNKVKFTTLRDTSNSSYSNFKKYMTIIFSYAGTISLSQELKPVNISRIQVGDVFIVGGSPGHAVMVMDVAENEAGQKMFLLAQSFMPAQDMHILNNPLHPGEGPWYSAEFEDKLYTPEWHFEASDLKRFPN